MANKIEHKGTVERVEEGHIQVRILQTSACSECHAKSLCSSSESKEKLIDIYTPSFTKYKVGDEVNVCGTETMSRNAILIAFGLPLLLIILWITISILLLQLDEGETMVGLAVIMSVYYLILKLLSKKLTKSFAFWIKDNNKTI